MFTSAPVRIVSLASVMGPPCCPGVLGIDATGHAARRRTVHPVPPNLQLPGVAGPAEQQARYFQLMKQGWNNNDACRAVGICRKTGTRWRVGRTETKNGKTHSYPAVEPVNTTGISTRFLSEQERVRIADLHRVGKSTTSIAAELGRAVSTISRELQRNLDPAGGGYLPHTANRLAATRRLRPKTTRIAADPVLREFVDGRLAKRHSPEQISHELTVQFPDSPARQLCRGNALPGRLPARTQRPDQHRQGESAQRPAASSTAALPAPPARPPAARRDDRRPPGGGQ